MSLREAVEEVAAEMEHSVPASYEALGVWVKTWAKCLRMALKAAGPDPAPGIPQVGGFPFGGESPSAQEHRLMEQARQEARAARAKGEGQEAAEGVMSACFGGPAEGVYAPRAAAMPVGARMFVSGAVYELRDGGALYYAPPAEGKADGATHT